MEYDNWVIAQKKRQEFLVDVIQPLLPYSMFSSTIQWGGENNNPFKTFHGLLSTNNLLKESTYELKKSRRLIHFTSIQSLSSIITNGFVRMTELKALEDISELSYASKVFQENPIFRHDETIIDKSKSKLYCFSACLKTSKNLKDLFMWENYGAKGKGVILEFTLSNLNAHRFATGQVKYGDINLNIIRDLKFRAELYYNKNNFFPSNPIELFSIFKSFHKSLRFKNEKEIRVLFSSNEFGNKIYPTIYNDINKNNKVTSYNKVFLKNRSPFTKTDTEIYPEISIKKVILGYDLKIEEKNEIAKFLRSLQNKKFKFRISHLDDELNEIDLTQLCKY
jgi:hypothetical protein